MRNAMASGRRPVIVLAAVLTAAALAVTACSAGQDAQTVEQTPVVDGQAFQAGLIDLRDVGISAPAVGQSYQQGGTAYLQGVIINSGRESDQLVSVSTSAAQAVEFFPDSVSALLASGSSSSAIPSGSSTVSEQPGAPSSSANDTGSPSGVNSGQASASASQSASLGDQATSPAPTTTSTSTTTTSQALSDIAVDPNQLVRVGYSASDVQIVLRDLTRNLFPAETVQMTFTFAKAGAVTVTLGVKLIKDATSAAPSVDTGKIGE